MIRAASILVLLAIFGLWGIFVAAIANDQLEIPGTWNFAQTGQLGDSFGLISAFMATAAAIFTFNTLQSEREETRRRDEADRRRDAEQTFFRLLALRNELISGISVRSGVRTIRGLEALAHLTNSFVQEVEGRSFTSAGDAYGRLFDRWRDQLGHYFRHTYHVALFADQNFEATDNYKYVRLLRAQMSNSEQTMLALNCLYGEGRKRFKTLVEYYSMLHNIHPEERQKLDLDLLFEPSAFDPPPMRAPQASWLTKWATATYGRALNSFEATGHFFGGYRKYLPRLRGGAPKT